MSLTQELAKRRGAARKANPSDKLAVMDRAAEDLSESGIIDSALRQGDTAPEFVLHNALGKPVSLTAMLKTGPVVLSFYRGEW